MHGPGEHVQQFDVATRTAEEPGSKLAHEDRGDNTSDATRPRTKPLLELLRGDVFGDQVSPGQRHVLCLIRFGPPPATRCGSPVVTTRARFPRSFIVS